MTIENEIKSRKGFSKLLRNAGNDKILKRVNAYIHLGSVKFWSKKIII